MWFSEVRNIEEVSKILEQTFRKVNAVKNTFCTGSPSSLIQSKAEGDSLQGEPEFSIHNLNNNEDIAMRF